LGIAIFMILVTQQTEAFKIGCIHTQMDLFSLYNFYCRRFSQIGIKHPLKGINRKITIAAQCLECLSFKYLFLKPNEAIL
jgi:hypothetical protein